MKYVVVLGDGMADYPVEELGGKTPLDVAKHPAMDELACCGEFGLAKTVPDGMAPGSDTANLAVFGYDPRIYYSGRSPLEAASLGIDLACDDVTYRCNFVTLAPCDALDSSTMLDYSAGEISTEEAHALVDCLNEHLSTDAAQLHGGFLYRQCLVLHHAETGAVLTPPHDISGQTTAGRLPQGTNAELLRHWMVEAHKLLSVHPINVKRVAEGKNPANAIWFWGEGRQPALTAFREKTGLHGAVVSAVDLVQGIGKCADMQVLHVEGATGTFETNFSGKADAALDALRHGCDYVYVHLEAPDECGHHRQIQEKIYSIEQIDQKVLAPILHTLTERGEPFTILLMPDHPTPIVKMTHVSDPVPYVLYRSGDKRQRSVRYCEEAAKATGVYCADASTLIDRMLGR